MSVALHIPLTTSGAPFTRDIKASSCLTTDIMNLVLLEKSSLNTGELSLLISSSKSPAFIYLIIAPSVGLPTVLSPSTYAVELAKVLMVIYALLGITSFTTFILFSVRVPVLSVRIRVVAPRVSQACILRTKLLALDILFIEYARAKVTAIGNPSGTATTINATAIIKKDNKSLVICIQSCPT